MLLHLTANVSGRIRHETFNRRHFIAAPMTMIVPGVLSGNNGPILYPAQELSKNVAAWNGKPLVLGHPQAKSGKYISARHPDVLNAIGMGFIFNAKADPSTNGNLVAEAWFDVEATRRVSPETLNRLQAGQPIELSTGLSTKAQPAPAGSSFKGRFYTHVAYDYKPDHLAILPNERGACSINDGCGVLNTETEMENEYHYQPEYLTANREGMGDNEDVLPWPTMNWAKEQKPACTCGANGDCEQVANQGDGLDDVLPHPTMNWAREKGTHRA